MQLRAFEREAKIMRTDTDDRSGRYLLIFEPAILKKKMRLNVGSFPLSESVLRDHVSLCPFES